LLPLMRDAPSNRAPGLALVPPDIREVVKARLDQWTILPPQLQEEFLVNERSLQYFAHLDISNNPSLHLIAPPGSDLKRWVEMTESQRKQIAANVDQFFALTPDEKQTALDTLSDVERQQMEKTLHAFDQLPPSQREECVRAFAKFASMSAAEKQEFLKNAQRWSEMTPADRQAWRDLVANVPEWPPLPEGFITPPPLPLNLHPAGLTNSN